MTDSGTVGQPDCQQRDLREETTLQEVERQRGTLQIHCVFLAFCVYVCILLPGTREGFSITENLSSQITHRLAYKTAMKKIERGHISLEYSKDE